MKTGIKAFVFGIAAYIIPFLFVYNPALLWVGSAGSIIVSCVHGLLSVLSLACAINGFLFKRMSPLERLWAFAAAVMLVILDMTCDIIGYALAAVTIVLQTQNINTRFFLLRRA